jgi:hypothetical protein
LAADKSEETAAVERREREREKAVEQLEAASVVKL